MAEANRIAREVSQDQAEVHAQFSLNLAPCGCNCRFCSFAAVNDIFKENKEISVAEAVQKALRFEADGANAVFMMATANYSSGKFLEITQEVRKSLKPETIMIANVGDQSLREAKKLREAGFQGVYHALRLREGVDTGIAPEKRKKSIRNFQEAGLLVGTCVEPVGPDHTNEELAEMILYTASIKPAYSGAARRITIPGGVMEQAGMISELRMAQIVAITRLAMPRSTKGNCTHEPCTIGALAGANLFWAEVGANPRDIRENTEAGRGGTVAHGRKLFQEADWETLAGPSVFYRVAESICCC
jgi:biotin synthase